MFYAAKMLKVKISVFIALDRAFVYIEWFRLNDFVSDSSCTHLIDWFLKYFQNSLIQFVHSRELNHFILELTAKRFVRNVFFSEK